MTISIINENDKEQLKDIVPGEYLFGDSLCICAFEEEELCAVLVAAAVSDLVWDIRWIYVFEEYRRQGIGSDMLSLLRMTAGVSGAEALSMDYLCGGGDDELLAFTVKMGFDIRKSTAVYSSSLSAAGIALMRYEGTPDPKYRMVPLRDVTNKEWNEMMMQLDKLRKDAGETEDVYIRPAHKYDYEEDISFAALDKEGRAAAILLARYDKAIDICFLCNMEKNDPRLTVRLIKSTCSAAEDKYPECEIFFHAANPLTEKMGQALLKRRMKKAGDALYMVSYL